MSEDAKIKLIAWGGIILLFLFLAFVAYFNTSNSRDEVYECSSCGRVFTNRDDVNSIRRTSMCEPCYDDFKYSQELYDAAKKYEERNR